MTADENASASTAQDFAVMLDGCDKMDLLDVESELAGLHPTLHVLDESEHRYGEPGTLALVAFAGSLALPPLMRWLANHRKGFKVTEQREMTLPDGTRVITLVLEFGHFQGLTIWPANVSLAIVKQAEAVRKRDKLAADLPTSELLRGSLLHRTIRHKSGCPKCERGEGHPVLVLAVSGPGRKVRQISLRPEQEKLVERWIGNYHNLRDRIEEVCELNLTLLRPEP